MSEIHYDPDGHQEDTVHAVGVQLVCFVCGCEKPNAGWLGHLIIGVCSNCAMEVLPVLLVDAIAADPDLGPDNVPSRLRFAIPKIIGRLWEGAAVATHRRLMQAEVRLGERTCPTTSPSASRSTSAAGTP